MCVLELSRIGSSSSSWGLEGEPGKGRKVSKSTRDRNMKESIIAIPCLTLDMENLFHVFLMPPIPMARRLSFPFLKACEINIMF